MIVDLRGGSGAIPRDFDVCVVGAGPAGLPLALRLAERGLRVGVLEAGGRRATVRNQRMLIDRPSGTRYWDLQNVRVRVFGGSGTRWGGISRPLDPLDLTARPWVEDSGWPLDWSEFARYAEQAAQVLELPADDRADVRQSEDPGMAGFALADYRLSPQVDFGGVWYDAVSRSSRLTALLNLAVTSLRPRPDGTGLASIEAAGPDGTRHTITARRFVLAAGGIENARILLASGLGNEHDMVGRCFMEHVHAPVAQLVPTAAFAEWSSYDLSTWPRLVRALVPTPSEQRSGELLNASMAIGPVWYVGEPPFVRRDYRVRMLYERMARHVGTLRWLPRRLRALVTQDVPIKADGDARLIVYRGEQPPRRSNRVVLSDKRDAHGVPLAHLHWTLDARELDNADRVLALFTRAIQERGLGIVEPMPDWRAKVIGGPHHMGTTRMSADPRDGVVDSNCKVHSLDNLYVAGSSVFSTGGHTSPTLTLVALSLRLADHLAATR